MLNKTHFECPAPSIEEEPPGPGECEFEMKYHDYHDSLQVYVIGGFMKGNYW